ncbi:aldo/keto reductase [Leptolyngbya sp. FACHB-17]|uniref:aldo/keto reductase n=1 Tax=unclassified Leptolyngbya TaxID=2650499 RepID=UPI00168177AE|nr:aldo/keto reductase [Leptolyngbya sp. FACHB-17]MBD2082035.1 aldo/keto reductase [Leptolyngbya sp. FACHB-17]
MQYRRFGQTNLFYSMFSLGTMRCLSSPQVMEQTVQRAIEFGINHIETARGYGKSEEFLGMALQAVARDSLFLTTKLPPSLDAAQTARLIDESLERLQVSSINSIAIHGLNTWEHLDWVKAETGCMKAIQEAIADGRVRHIGFSTHGSLDLILATIETSLFEFVNLHYSFFFQRNAPAIELAHQKDMGVFIISPADKAGMLHTPPQTLIDLCAPFSPLELNYRFLLSDSRITTLSVGAAKPEELDLPDLEKDLSIEEAIDRLQARTAIDLNQCSQCYQCLPCPESIHIPEVLRLRNLATAYDMTGFGEYRYRMFENAGHWFPGNKANRCTDCGDCLPRCPEELDIPKLLRETHDRLNGNPGRRLWQD